jgi:hypothetical protein
MKYPLASDCNTHDAPNSRSQAPRRRSRNQESGGA